MNIKVEALKRELGRKSEINQMRKNGFIPAILYGSNRESMPIKLEKGSFLKVYRKTIGELAFFDLSIDNKMCRTIIKDKQIHPVTREIEHIDFMEIRQDAKITVKIPFRIEGTPVGVKNGGFLEVLLREVEASSFPKDLVEDIMIDVSALEIGDSITVGDVSIENVEFLVGNDVPIVVVHPPKAAEADTSMDEEGTETLEKKSENEE
jgi:large subunit ribosomal protein L25